MAQPEARNLDIVDLLPPCRAELSSLETRSVKAGRLPHEWVTCLASWERDPRHGGASGTDDLLRESGAEWSRDHGPADVQRRPGLPGRRPNGRWVVGRGAALPRAGSSLLTHHERETVQKEGGTTFALVTDGNRVGTRPGARGRRREGRLLAGGADVTENGLKAGLCRRDPAPRCAGDPRRRHRLFEGVGPRDAKVELAEVDRLPNATHIRYRSGASSLSFEKCWLIWGAPLHRPPHCQPTAEKARREPRPPRPSPAERASEKCW